MPDTDFLLGRLWDDDLEAEILEIEVLVDFFGRFEVRITNLTTEEIHTLTEQKQINFC